MQLVTQAHHLKIHTSISKTSNLYHGPFKNKFILLVKYINPFCCGKVYKPSNRYQYFVCACARVCTCVREREYTLYIMYYLCLFPVINIRKHTGWLVYVSHTAGHILLLFQFSVSQGPYALERTLSFHLPQKGSQVTVLFSLNVGARWCWVVNTMPQTPQETAPIPIIVEDGWAPGHVLRGQNLLPLRDWNPRLSNLYQITTMTTLSWHPFKEGGHVGNIQFLFTVFKEGDGNVSLHLEGMHHM